MTDSFVFYRSFQECLEHVDDASYRRIMTAITTYALNDEMPSLQGLELAVFIAIKPQIDANIKRRENGKLGGRASQTKTAQPETAAVYIEETSTNHAEPNRTSSNQTEPNYNQNKANHTKANQSEPNPNQAEPNANVNANENENVFFTAAEKTVLLFLPEHEQERIIAQLRDIWNECGMPFFNADINTPAKQQVILQFRQHPAYVIAAIQNAAKVQKLIDAKQSWRERPIGFNSFCEHFSEYAGDSFNLERYLPVKEKRVTPAAAVIDNEIFDDPAEVERRLAELYKQAETDNEIFDDPAEVKRQLTALYAHG